MLKVLGAGNEGLSRGVGAEWMGQAKVEMIKDQEERNGLSWKHYHSLQEAKAEVTDEKEMNEVAH